MIFNRSKNQGINGPQWTAELILHTTKPNEYGPISTYMYCEARSLFIFQRDA